MSFTIEWPSIPYDVRRKFCAAYPVPINMNIFKAELAKFHCEYTSDNLAIFESEAYYTWFVLRWS